MAFAFAIVPSVYCGLTGQAEAGAVLVETPWAPLSLLLQILERVLSSGPAGPVRIKGDKHGGVERAQAARVPGEARHSVGWPLKPYNCVRIEGILVIGQSDL